MSSKEMADLTEKRHDSVKRTMDTLAEKGLIQPPQIVEVTNHLGQTVTEYRFGKRDSYVIVAQLSPEFTARLVDRWQELEEQVHRAQHVIPQSLSEALRLAADLADMKAKADAALAIAAPKAEALDRLTLADGSFCIRDAAKTLQVNERTSKQTLLGRRWVHLSLVVRHPRLLQHLNHFSAVHLQFFLRKPVRFVQPVHRVEAR
jgi:phage regulator Rha-like protein